MNCISCSIVSKIIFCYKFSDIPEKSQREKKTNNKAIAKRYALKGNPKS